MTFDETIKRPEDIDSAELIHQRTGTRAPADRSNLHAAGGIRLTVAVDGARMKQVTRQCLIPVVIFGIESGHLDRPTIEDTHALQAEQTEWITGAWDIPRTPHARITTLAIQELRLTIPVLRIYS